MTRFIYLIVTILVASFNYVEAQIVNPVKWSVTLDMADDTHGAVVMTATVDAGWHVYSNDVDPDVGPNPLEIDWSKLDGVKLDGKMKPSKTPHKEFDEMFGANLSWWTDEVTLRQNFIVTSSKYAIEGAIRFSACNDENCIPPTKETFEFTGTAKIVTETPEEVAADTVVEAVAPQQEVASGEMSQSESEGIWAPVDFSGEDNPEDSSTTSLWYIFVTCFIGGFVALLTPCVWPMIPLTVSFFLKKGKSRAKAIGDATVYGVSIIVIYLLLGLLITAIFGASSLNALSTSAVCNIIFFLLLVVFAISFFGAFDIKLPESWANKMDSTAEKTTGLLSIFFMAFTLTLVSFSCTGPIIGTLLVEAASTGDKFGPAVGMFGFSLALAIPFCLFAMFPSWLQSAPKSGGWMNTVKVVLGFIELALSLKFLSVADLAYGWHILDREAFLALWIVIFALLGMYLLGKFNFSHYGPADSSVGVFRFFLAMISFSFTIYLVPGLWGAPLKGVSAFVPPLFTQDFNLYGGGFKEYDDYEEGMKAALEEGKPVLVDFSGYGCVNCRKMEGAVLDESNVHAMIEDNFVVIKLMVDEKKELPVPETVMENGKKVTLETYGDRWSYLQRYKFQANAQPYYVVLDAKGELLSGPFSYDENIPKFTRFLEKGIKEYKK
ncbi:thiol:disulfide interchange protein [Barnesiella sp. WM24]|uniref:protein-disulfide reductase DsbD family protein n=1 Tax=Barnesiella sp. WM24 TaxID=2558278 RepID=UPI0010719DDE|nr:cytochrome c biogenesis protein CcdA [Barnesiella sp. WM24]TFU93692.1 thiol:disulfide interchange protein [Barnesiella sp. WM24]